jgi:hypothetical protein
MKSESIDVIARDCNVNAVLVSGPLRAWLRPLAAAFLLKSTAERVLARCEPYVEEMVRHYRIDPGMSQFRPC